MPHRASKCALTDELPSLGEDWLFTFLRFPNDQWKSIRATNAVERLHEEFEHRIKAQCLLPCAKNACMLFWALLASGQITMRRSTVGEHVMSPLPRQHLISSLDPII